MKLTAFLKDRVVSLILFLLVELAICGIALVCGLTRDAVLLMALVLLLACAIALGAEYLRNRAFLRDLTTLTEQLEHPYQLHSLIKHHAGADQTCVYNALETMGIASGNEVLCAQAQAKEQSEYMEAWVHEAKTPLAAALLVAERVPEPEQTSLKRELDRACKQLEQVLWYARSTSAENDYIIREQHLLSIVRQACKENARYLIECGVQLRIEISEDLYVYTDEKQVAFILSQLLVNSAKYGAHQVRFSAAKSDISPALTLVVEDDGLGIPAHDVPRVFERGFTGTRGRELGSSTGMGLYICARMCETLGLGLSIASEEGEGTRVMLVFPHDSRRWEAQKMIDCPQAATPQSDNLVSKL